MTKRDRQLSRLFNKPADFRWNDLVGLLLWLGFEQLEGDGSRVKFYHRQSEELLSLHKPHPGNTIKEYVVKYVVETLKRMGVKP